MPEPGGKHAPRHPLCARFGYDEPRRRAERIALVGLDGPEDPARALRLNREVLVPCARGIIARFAERLTRLPSWESVMRRGGDPARLREAHEAYLRGLGLDYAGADHFEACLRMGVVHADFGVPAGDYIAAYGAFQDLVGKAIRERLAPDEQAPLRCTLAKLCLLDASLVTEAYLHAELSELKALVAAERERARRDALTGTLGRGAVLEALKEALGKAAIERVPLSLVMVDLDGFKAVNDTWGHPAGDAVLREAAGRIRSAVRDFDLVGRYGGEEFLVVLRATPLDVARRIAERIRARMAEGPFEVRGSSVALTASAGVAEARPGEGAEGLIARADHALYEAKRAGKNRVRVDLG